MKINRNDFIKSFLINTFFFLLVVTLSERPSGMSLLVSSLTYYAIWTVVFFATVVPLAVVLTIIVGVALELAEKRYDTDKVTKSLSFVSAMIAYLLFVAIVYPFISSTVGILVDLGWQQVLLIESLVLTVYFFMDLIQASNLKKA
jgi:hypothetical protein